MYHRKDLTLSQFVKKELQSTGSLAQVVDNFIEQVQAGEVDLVDLVAEFMNTVQARAETEAEQEAEKSTSHRPGFFQFTNYVGKH